MRCHQCCCSGLPAEFSSLKQHIRYHDGPLTLNQISGWLNAEELNLAMESKLSLADSTAQPTDTALYAAGQHGGSRPGRRGAHRGGGRGRQQSIVHSSSSGRSRSDQDNRRGGGGNLSSNRDLPVCQICEK